MAHLTILLSFSLHFLFLRSVSATCYWPDGNATSTDYAPCNYGVTSMCCDAAHDDICTAEGLCLYQETSYTRDACTDSTWTSPNCVSACMSVDGFSAAMIQCVDKTWCCVSNNENCCNDNQNIKLSPTSSTSSVIASSTISSSTIASSTPSSTSASSAIPSSSKASTFEFTNLPSSAATATRTTIAAGVGGATSATATSTSSSATSSQSTSAGSSSNIKIGIGLGLGLGVPLIAGIIVAT
ncbi:hypothetical protein AOQ84DRAFT_213534 [Glonium stellatum]|uniref:Uncharacterized protein n=1 Tax=Glonium stellatum TaxID=574774 RepID=A0A8E2F4S5_9PEZI|nr:hypothetical protein AOQ84DRAFT_213534 [Glonium stellatum]